MNTTIKNGELVKDSTQLQMEEIKVGDLFKSKKKSQLGKVCTGKWGHTRYKNLPEDYVRGEIEKVFENGCLWLKWKDGWFGWDIGQKRIYTDEEFYELFEVVNNKE
ncbi:MAG: hypothetical protein MRY51_08145 [Flavobacteriaceae bacterium]|nr:hypothetical protein [Flavobacteriaceae bacterium]MCI5087883.1 hypothetical protein [Flavobacteriaceae bacterium]